MAEAIDASNFEYAANLFNHHYPPTTKNEDIKTSLGLEYASVKQVQFAIKFTQLVRTELQPEVYKELYESIKLNEWTREPEMLLLQKNIGELLGRISFMDSDNLGLDQHILEDVKKQVDVDCKNIIIRLIKEIGANENSISKRIVDSVGRELLDENIQQIVSEFYSGTWYSTLMLFEYSLGLPMSTKCFLVYALLNEFKRLNLLESIQAMYLYAFAKDLKRDNLDQVQLEVQNVCNEVISTLSPFKNTYFQNFQDYFINNEKLNICESHSTHWESESLVKDFVSFYYNCEDKKVHKLIKAAKKSTRCIYAGRILMHLHNEMKKNGTTNSFQALTLFNAVKVTMSSSNFCSQSAEAKALFVSLKSNAPAWVRQLLWPDGSSRFKITNKCCPGRYLCTSNDNKLVWKSINDGQVFNEGGWKMSVDKETSLLTIAHPCGMELGLERGTAKLMPLPKSKFIIQRSFGGQYFEIFNNKGQ